MKITDRFYMMDHTIQLSDGRRLGYTEYGDPNGKPVFLFHGNPGSRRGWKPQPGKDYAPGIRIIAPDRPGFGLSDFKPGRTYADWPDDVLELANQLGIEKFAIIGVSGGGPNTLACAWKIPDRLTGVGVISSGPPVADALEGLNRKNRLIMTSGKYIPKLIKLNSRFLSTVVKRKPEKMINMLLSSYPDCDKKILQQKAIKDVLMADMQQAFLQGGRGSAHEVILFSNPWLIPLDKIEIDVHIWHGELDNATPPSFAKYLEKVIPNCHINIIPDAGHLWVFDGIHTVIETLCS
ncbi:alpha/beta fold hydrolase [Vallitalea okinawensis]|uniref:alpha/beta fold hydrolase n=1 Tax=Vallitalea okinawensis TaxID=2078660 RepID=UPI000CFD4601|nr:alpha/beta hydrolase [Vallitalea okinawensis]